MCEIQKFLNFSKNTSQDLHILFNYSILPDSFSIQQIKSFYFCNLEEKVIFSHECLTVSEIFYYSSKILDAVDDELFCCIVVNHFYRKNRLGNISVFSLDDISNLEYPSHHKLLFNISMTERVRSLIEKNLLPVWIADCDSSKVKLTRNNIEYYLNKEIDIASLMAFQHLDQKIISLIIKKLLTDMKYMNQCKKFILDQGILNNTMFVISSLLSNQASIRSCDYKEIQKYYCDVHFSNLCLPYSAFYDIHDISKNELFFVYLIKKSDLKDSVSDICSCIKDEFLNSQNTRDAKAEPSISSLFSTNDAILSKSLDLSLTPIENIKIRKRSLGANLLDLILRNSLPISFDSDVFSYLYELSSESYYNDVVKKHTRDILVYKIPYITTPYLEESRDMFNTIERLLQSKPKDQLECKSDSKKCKLANDKLLSMPDITCSIDDIRDSVIFSSLDTNKYEIKEEHDNGITSTQDTIQMSLKTNGLEISNSCHEKNAYNQCPSISVPLIDFKIFNWMTEFEKNFLLEMQSLYYPVTDLVSNFLEIKSPSRSIVNFFMGHLQDISCRMLKFLVCCKLNLDFDTSELKDHEIHDITGKIDNLYPLREFILTKKVPKKTISRLVETVSLENLKAMILQIDCSRMTEEACCVLISCLGKRFDLKDIGPYFLQFLKLKNVNIAQNIQKYLIQFLKDMFYDSSYIYVIEDLYKELVKYEDKSIRLLNEKIVMILAKSGRDMNKDAFIGNLK